MRSRCLSACCSGSSSGAIGYLYARGRLAEASGRARAAEQRAALIDGQLAEQFQALSAQALDASTARFLEVAEGRLHAANATAAASWRPAGRRWSTWSRR